MNTAQNSYVHAQWDKEGSTYHQDIYFTNGKFIEGYSKRLNHPEPNNKFTVLTNWILRTYRDGYLNEDKIGTKRPSGTFITEVDTIVYYRNDFPDRVKILSISYDYFQLHEENEELEKFLNRFYEMKEKGIDPDKIFNSLYSNKKTAYVEPMEIPVQSAFSHPKFLMNYCISLYKKRTATKTQILEFFHNYMDRHFNTPLFPKLTEEWSDIITKKLV